MLAAEAEQQAGAADERVKATEQIRGQSVTTAKETARDAEPEATNGVADSGNKSELSSSPARSASRTRTP
jgi:hypothetical protein